MLAAGWAWRGSGAGGARPAAPGGVRRLGDHRRGPRGAAGPRPGPSGLLVALVAVSALALAAIVAGPAACPPLAVGGLAARARIVRRRRARQLAALDRALPEVVDLFLVAAAAGLPVSACLRAVADRAPPAARPALAGAVAHAARGAPLAVALARLGPALGTLGPSLTEVLIGAHRSGAALRPRLERVAAATRDARRRRAEEAARRLPVTLLFPLVCCVLPAFGLLAVVPLLVASLGSLQP